MRMSSSCFGKSELPSKDYSRYRKKAEWFAVVIIPYQLFTPWCKFLRFSLYPSIAPSNIIAPNYYYSNSTTTTTIAMHTCILIMGGKTHAELLLSHHISKTIQMLKFNRLPSSFLDTENVLSIEVKVQNCFQKSILSHQLLKESSSQQFFSFWLNLSWGGAHTRVTSLQAHTYMYRGRGTHIFRCLYLLFS